MATEAARPRLQVLIVDPQPDNRFILREKLSELTDWAVSIDMCSEPNQALELLARVYHDLAFVNRQAGDGAGLDLLERVLQRSPRTAVLFMTAAGEEQLAVEALRRGAIDFLANHDLRNVNMRHLLRRVMAKRDLHNQFATLRKVNLLKDDFIGNVSHELRTPLTVILGYARTLLEGKIGPVNEQQRQALASIEERGTHLMQAVNQLLEFKTASEGAERLLLEPIDWKALVEIALAQAQGTAARKGLRIATDLPAGEVWIRADRERLSDVLDNLFSNAVKFSPKGGLISVKLAAEDDEAVFSVKDQGPGIPPETLPHVFETFAQSSQGLTREHSGLGLGLAISRQLVEMHGGRVWLQSEGHGKGAAASVALPLAAPNAPEVTIEEKVRFDKRRILIVEDNPDIVELIRLFLLAFSPNIHIAAARSGFEALEYLTHHQPHLMVLDIMMQGMDGFEVIERLKKLPGKANIPILVLTGYPDAAERAKQLGAHGVLLKPFEKERFTAEIIRLMAKPAGG